MTAPEALELLLHHSSDTEEDVSEDREDYAWFGWILSERVIMKDS